MLNSNKYMEYGQNAKLNAEKFLWSNIIEEYKKII